MAKKTCLTSNQYSLVVDEMVNAMEKIPLMLETNLNKVTVLRAFRASLKEKYNDLAYALDDAIQQEYGYDITSNDLVVDKVKPKKLKEIGKILSNASAIFIPMEDNIGGLLYNFQQDALEIADEDRMFNNDIYNNIMNSGQNFGEAGLSNQIAQFNASVGAILSDSQFKSVDEQIATKPTFKEFYEWLADQDFYEEGKGLPDFDTESLSGKARIKLLKGYYVGRRPLNKIDRVDKNMQVITNIDPNKLASLNGQIKALRGEGYSGRELNKQVAVLFRDVITDPTQKYLMDRPDVSLHNKRPLPAKETASFHDKGPNAKRTKLINIKDFVTLHQNENGWWSRPSHYTFSEDYLNTLEYMQGNDYLSAPIGMVSGSNGNILYTKISLADVRDVFPDKHVIAALKDAGYSPAILKAAKERLKTNSVVRVMKGLEARAERYYIAKRNNQFGKLSAGAGITKIISGGQVGADFIGLELAKEMGITTGGTAPPGFQTSTGPQEVLLKSYGLKEGEADPVTYRKRTIKNVQDSDGTVLFGKESSPGSKLTKGAATANKKPYLSNPTAKELSTWIIDNNIKTLNIAGNRAIAGNQKAIDKMKLILREAITIVKSTKPDRALQQAEMALDAERFEKAEANITVVGRANLVKLLRKDKKNFTEADIEVVKETINNDAPRNTEGKALSSTIYIPGLLAKIRWLQAERGDDFLFQNPKKGADPFNIFDRLRINFSMGMATETLGDAHTALVNQDTIYYKLDGKIFKHLRDIPGISGKVNIPDGVTWGSTSYLSSKGQAIGSYKVYDDEHDFKQLKTVESHLARDKKGKYLGYFERKHAVSEGIDGLEIYDSRTDELLISMKREAAYNNEIIIYDPVNNKFVDTIGDYDSGKTHSGIYDLKDKSIKFFTLPEASSRMIVAPKSKGNVTASGFGQYLSALNYTFDKTKEGKKQKQAFDNYKNVLKEILFTNMRDYLDAFYNASIDSNGLWELVQHQFSEEAQMKHTLRDKLNISKGAGIMHQTVLNQLIPQLINTILKEGALKGRTLSPRVGNALLNVDMKDKMVGSHYIFVPGREVKEGTLELSSDIDIIFNRIKELSGLEDISEINDWLDSNPQYVLPYRFPILGVGALQPRLLAKFHADMGQAVYLHPNDTFGTHKGDNDIDSADILLLQEGQAESMISVQATKWFKEKIAMVADIDMFEEAEPKHILSTKDTRDAMLDLLHAQNAQGQATNWGSNVSTIGAKINSIGFSDGIIATPKKLSDIVVMDYIPVKMSKKAFEKKWEDVDSMSLVNKDGSPYKGGSGKKYLQTTVDYETTQITNIAIDNIKSGRLCNMCEARSPEWFVERMFTFNESPSPTHLKLLGQVVANFRYKNHKTMSSNEKKFLTLDEWYKGLHELDGDLNNPRAWSDRMIAELEEVLVDTTVEGVKMRDQDLDLKPYLVSITNIDMNKTITLQEEFITEPWNHRADRIEKNEISGVIPFDIDAAYTTRRASHYKASDRYLMSVIMQYNISKKGNDAAEAWADSFTEAYYGQLKINSQSIGSTNEFSDVQAEFDLELKKIITEYKKELMSIDKIHGNGASRLASALVLWGVDTQYRKNIPDPNALIDDSYRMYMKLWEEAYVEYDKDGNHIASLEFPSQYGNKFPASRILEMAREKRKVC